MATILRERGNIQYGIAAALAVGCGTAAFLYWRKKKSPERPEPSTPSEGKPQPVQEPQPQADSHTDTQLSVDHEEESFKPPQRISIQIPTDTNMGQSIGGTTSVESMSPDNLSLSDTFEKVSPSQLSDMPESPTEAPKSEPPAEADSQPAAAVATAAAAKEPLSLGDSQASMSLGESFGPASLGESFEQVSLSNQMKADAGPTSSEVAPPNETPSQEEEGQGEVGATQPELDTPSDKEAVLSEKEVNDTVLVSTEKTGEDTARQPEADAPIETSKEEVQAEQTPQAPLFEDPQPPAEEPQPAAEDVPPSAAEESPVLAQDSKEKTPPFDASVQSPVFGENHAAEKLQGVDKDAQLSQFDPAQVHPASVGYKMDQQ